MNDYVYQEQCDIKLRYKKTPTVYKSCRMIDIGGILGINWYVYELKYKPLEYMSNYREKRHNMTTNKSRTQRWIAG